MYGKHTRWHVWWRRNTTAGRIIIFTRKNRANELYDGRNLCTRKRGRTESEVNYFRESRHVCK